jgi:hypothetical protein
LFSSIKHVGISLEDQSSFPALRTENAIFYHVYVEIFLAPVAIVQPERRINGIKRLMKRLARIQLKGLFEQKYLA